MNRIREHYLDHSLSPDTPSRVNALWILGDVMIAVPQYAFHLFWGGLFGYAVAGGVGLIVGGAIGFATSCGVLWLTLRYIGQARRWLAREIRRLNRQWILEEEEKEPSKYGHPNLVALVYPFIAFCEAFLAMMVIVCGYIILAQENHEAYVFLHSFLSPATEVLFSHFPYLDNYLDELRQDGQGERAEFVRLGVTSIWIVGAHGLLKAVHGMLQGWVFHLRYLRFARFEVVKKQELAGLLLSLIASISALAFVGDFFWASETVFSPFKTHLPLSSTYSISGLLPYLFNLAAILTSHSVGIVLFISFFLVAPAVLSKRDVAKDSVGADA